MRTIVTVLFGLCLIAMSVGIPVQAQAPTLPHAFFGTVEIAGAPAPANTQIEARGADIAIGIPGNPLYTTEPGKYGGATAFAPKLVVQGAIAQGAPVEFYVNGVKAQCAIAGGAWQDSFPFATGAVTQLSLKVEQAAPALPTPTHTATQLPTATATGFFPTATPTAAAMELSMATLTPTQVSTPGDAPTATRDPSAPTLTPVAESTAPSVFTPTVAVVQPAATSVGTVVVSMPTSALATPVAASTGQTPAATASTTLSQASIATVAPTLQSALIQPTSALIVPTIRAPHATSAPILPRGTIPPTSMPPNGASPTRSTANGLLLWLGTFAVAAALVTVAGVVIWLRKRG